MSESDEIVLFPKGWRVIVSDRNFVSQSRSVRIIGARYRVDSSGFPYGAPLYILRDDLHWEWVGSHDLRAEGVG
jgi:hypothetical protein